MNHKLLSKFEEHKGIRCSQVKFFQKPFSIFFCSLALIDTFPTVCWLSFKFPVFFADFVLTQNHVKYSASLNRLFCRSKYIMIQFFVLLNGPKLCRLSCRFMNLFQCHYIADNCVFLTFLFKHQKSSVDLVFKKFRSTSFENFG